MEFIEENSSATSIKGIKFTPREIDIISCIISGRSVKSMSNLIDISAKTADFHIRNIMTKLGCNSKDSIARIAEESEEYNFLLEHYQNIYRCRLLNKLIPKIKLLNKNHRIFVSHNLPESDMSRRFVELLFQCEFIVEKDRNNENLVCVVVNSKKIFPDEKDNEVSLFCSIIRCICSDDDVLLLITKLENKQEIKASVNSQVNSKRISIKHMIISLLAVFVISICCIKIYLDKKAKIMSNLYYASDNILVRTALLRQIDESIKKNKNDIKVTIIAGPGGAGKTTLARDFLKDESIPIKWEINAESTQTIIDSFYDLATVIADKQNIQGILDDIKSTSNPTERTKRIMLFVQSYMKQLGTWCLLFDNVDEMDFVKEYFPLNSEVWGRGTVLVTTRNENTGDCDLFRSAVIVIGQLSADEQYRLFCGILYGGIKSISIEKSAEINLFLSKIPLFPLDVSSAAHYIKNTKTKFDDYLSCILSFSEKFEKVHEKIVSKYTGYNRTRNGITISIFNKIVQGNPEFKDLLLLICIVDSQNIPIRFLEEYKNKIMAQEFIHTLRRFSVITQNQNSFSLHRRTQKVGLQYVLSLLSVQEKTRILDQIVKVLTPYGRMLLNRYEKQENYLSKLEQKAAAQHARFFMRNIEDIDIDKKNEYRAKLLLAILYEHRTNDNFSEALIPIADQILEMNKGGLYIKGYDFAVLQLESIYYHFSIKDYSGGEKKLEKVMAICDEIKAESLKVIATVYFAQFYCETDDFERCQQYLDQARNLLDRCEGQMAAVASTVLATRYQICYLYHYIRGEKLSVAVASFEDSLKRLGASIFFHKNPDKYKKLSRIQYYMIPNARKRLANVYNHLEMYDKARECEEEAKFFYEREETFNAIGMLVKIDEGYTLLRTNKVSEARDVLSKTIEIKQKLGASQDMLEALVWISEANIRLGNFVDAYANCQEALKLTKKSKTNFAKLLKVLCYYHMAVAKYKMSDNGDSINYFQRFFELSDEFCNGFLEKNTYEKLQKEQVVKIAKDKSPIKICLQNSLKIFSAIYGEEHSFVKNYASKIE